MGRGRAKAKQQKVARELKYNTHFTDLDALQRELGAGERNGFSSDRPSAVEDDDAEDDTGEDADDGTERYGGAGGDDYDDDWASARR